jgi:hypothetical protein
MKRQLPGWAKSPAMPIVTFVIVTVLGQVMGVRAPYALT